MACACLDTSVLASLENDKHTNKTKLKQTKKRSVAEQITPSLFYCYFKWLIYSMVYLTRVSEMSFSFAS